MLRENSHHHTHNKRFIGKEMSSVMNLMRREVEKVSERAELEKSTMTHGFVLGYLEKNRDKPIFQKNIEDEFTIRRSTATKILQKMEANELIIRVPVPEDARLKKIELTPKALKLHHLVIHERLNLEKKIMANISPEDLDTFYSVLEKVKQNLT